MHPSWKSPDGNLDNELILLETDTVFRRLQSDLFQKHFSVPALVETALATRAIVDETVRQTLGRPYDRTAPRLPGFSNIDHYPVGYCGEITHTVEAILRGADKPRSIVQASRLSRCLAANFERWNTANSVLDTVAWERRRVRDLLHPQQEMARRITRFEKAGGIFGSAWLARPGDPSFQWCLLIGDRVLDVAGDAMDRLEYPVSIATLDDGEYRSIRDYADYAHIAKGYWHKELYRNTLLPTIAPAFPIVSMDSIGQLHFERPSILIKRSIVDGFQTSWRAWQAQEFENPPQELEEAVWWIAPAAVPSIKGVYENWKQAAEESQSSDGSPAYLSSLLQWATRLAQKFEFEWQERMGHELHKKISEKKSPDILSTT